MFKHFFLLFFTFFFGRISAQILQNKIFADSIKTAYIHLKGDKLSYPILRLGTNDILVLEFDDLNMNNSVSDYQYTFIHCNKNWEPSELTFDQYIDGFEENYVDNYKFSFNTLTNYVHYSVQFPNDNIKFLKSGNYIILIYKDGDTSQKILQMRFIVVEPLVEVKGTVHIPSLSLYRNNYQEVDFEVDSKTPLTNPLEYVDAAVLQNWDWNTVKYLKPRFIQGNNLIYDYEKENLFLGYNQFRYFITKNTNFIAPHTQKIKLNDKYEFILETDYPMTKYFFNNDINGRFYIRNERGFNDETEADYVLVHFFLLSPIKYNEDIYIYGALSLWQFDKRFKMHYDPKSGYYYTTLLLKQGVYNYSYRTPKNTGIIDGSFSETKNQYFIFVYYYDNALNYDKVIGYTVLKNF